MSGLTVETGPSRGQKRGPWRQQVAGLNVIKVRGSFYEMGRQHGEMLRDEVLRGPVPYYRRQVERLIGRTVLRPVSPLVWLGIQRLLGRRVARALPEFAHESLRGLAEGAGIPYDQMLDGCTMPDALVWLASRFMSLKRTDPAIHHRLALGLGCTSAIAWGDGTIDGRLLHARNFDFHGVESWPQTATVIFHEPDRGQRYVSVAAAGVPLGGVTAMNEAGLTLTVHQHMFTDRAAFGGTPVGVVGDVVMRQARDLDEAQAILEQHRPIGCWTYLVADGHRREVLCHEENPERRAAIRTSPEDSHFAYSNIYLDAELGATERNLYGSYWRHNRLRYERADFLLRRGAGGLDANQMAAILGDVGEPGCRIRGAIAMLLTVGSVVFRPEDGVLWVATGRAPVSHRQFVPFSLAAEDHVPDEGSLTGGVPNDEAAFEAFEQYRDAFLAYFDDADIEGSRRAMARACELQPQEPLYHAVDGFLALTAADAEHAERAFGRALDRGHPDSERLSAFHLWRARARDLLSRRDAALSDYGAALGRPADPPVHSAARRGLRRRYTMRRARRVAVDFSFADVMSG